MMIKYELKSIQHAGWIFGWGRRDRLIFKRA
ncbi:hypothetical protein B14911_17945 [Bacillus sp. NRRL B-14911]|nr:hypothetical protein B14911_17945 [Bacillus sp. NRRL B-14911]